jgi:hypothetical protein
VTAAAAAAAAAANTVRAREELAFTAGMRGLEQPLYTSGT